MLQVGQFDFDSFQSLLCTHAGDCRLAAP
jgi:hypothetical protein